MRVFVTGGAGFIGRHLVKSLLEKNYHVTIFDDFSNSSEGMISDLIDNGANLIKGDITKQEQISNAISGHDIVIHLAAKSSVEESMKFPKKTVSTNVDGTKNILNSCVKYNIKNIIAASSAAVYGEPKNPDLPISETTKTNPSSPYGESKLKMEQEIQSFSKKYNINSIILRIFNVYGKGQSDEYAGVITKFLEKISKNQSLEIFGDGLQTRDFIAIQDVVNSILCAISNIENKRGGIYNIASGRSISIKKLADLMISFSRKKLDIQYKKSKEADIEHSIASIQKAKTELGFLPKCFFEDELVKMIKKLK